MLWATIVVVAILTLLVFGLTLVAFSSFIKAEKIELDAGKKDEEIKNEKNNEKKKSSSFMNIFSNIVGGIVVLALLTVASIAVVYRASGEQLAINNHVSLVIVSDSMDGYYNNEYETELLEEKPEATKDQFKIGDFLDFTIVKEEDELISFDVYGYKTKTGKIITHRYIGETEDGLLVFRGDNTGGRDSYVNREQVILHYENFKIPRVGLFILFSQSGFGLYSFISAIVIYVLAEIYAIKYDKMIKNRWETILNSERIDKQATEKSKGKLVTFKTKSGKVVSFYRKDKTNEKESN